MDENTVTLSLKRLQNGDDLAAQELWEHYFKRLVSFSRSRVHRLNRAASDEEDIALSTFKSVCLGIRDGKFPRLTNRDGLWCLLLTIASRKAADKFAYDFRAKRCAKRTVTLGEENRMGEWLSVEPTAETEVEFADLLTSLLDSLQQESLKQVALLKLEGFTNNEISVRIGKSVATVERKLRTVREIWDQAS